MVIEKRAVSRSGLDNKTPQTPRDYFINLPDEVLLLILYNNPTKDNAQTTVLSRRWRGLWKGVQRLYFDSANFNENAEKFTNFVDRSIELYGCPKVEQFYLDCGFFAANRCDDWIFFALEKEVEVLFVNVDRGDLENDVYTLPSEIFKCSSLESFTGFNCKVKLPESFRLDSLKNMFLMRATLTDGELINKLLASCPVLEFFSFSGMCTVHVNINVAFSTNPCIEYFAVNGCDINCLEVDSPSLVSLLIGGRVFGNIILKDIASLNRASVDVNLMHYAILYQLFFSLCHVRDLTIGFLGVQLFSLSARDDVDDDHVQPPDFKCKHMSLKLEGGLDFTGLVGLARILQKSKDVEALNIFISYIYIAEESLEMRRACVRIANSPCLKNTVKTIEISLFQKFGFLDGLEEYISYFYETEATFLQILLKNALVLEKMIVYVYMEPGLDKNKRLQRQITRAITTFPRASSRAQVFVVFK